MLSTRAVPRARMKLRSRARPRADARRLSEIASITYRIAVGPHQGRKVFTLQTFDRGVTAEGEAGLPTPRRRSTAHLHAPA